MSFFKYNLENLINVKVSIILHLIQILILIWAMGKTSKNRLPIIINCKYYLFTLTNFADVLILIYAIQSFYCLYLFWIKMGKEMEKQKDDRIYAGLLRRVGQQGIYQTNLMRILYIVAAVCGPAYNIVPFLFYQEPFDCGNIEENCNQMACSLPLELRQQYLPSTPLIKSLGNFYGDTHCERMDVLIILKECFLIGTSVSVVAGILFVDFLGKKRILKYALVINIVSILAMTCFQSYIIKGISLFLWGGCLQLCYPILGAYITETNSERNRITCFAWRQLFFVFGCLINLFLFYIFRNWVVVLLVYFLTAYVIAAFGFFYYVESTPLELISKETPQEAFNAFIRIAERNQITDHGLTLQQIESLQKQYKQARSKQEDDSLNICYLFKHPLIRSDFFRVAFTYFLVVFLANSYAILLDQLNANIFVLTLTNITAQFLAIPFFRSLLVNFPRKTSQITTLIVITVLLLVTFGLVPNDCFNCKSGVTFIFILILFFFTRFAISISMNLIQCSLSETFPAQIRPIGIYSVAGTGRFAVVALPFSIKLRDAVNFPLLLQFSCVGILGVLGSAILRQTWGILPQELIQERKNNQKEKQIAD